MVTDNKAFCSTTGGLFYYGLEDNSLEKLSKTDGLSDNGVVAMSWSEEDQLALLAYSNANLDILKGNQIINIPDIMKKQIPGDKSVYHISFPRWQCLPVVRIRNCGARPEQAGNQGDIPYRRQW